MACGARAQLLVAFFLLVACLFTSKMADKDNKKGPCSYANAGCCSFGTSTGRPGDLAACAACGNGTYHNPCGKKFFKSLRIKKAEAQFKLLQLCLACATQKYPEGAR